MFILTEYGLGASLRRGDYTEAAKRAITDALWHCSIRAAEVFGKTKDDMRLTVEVGVAQPDQVDIAALRSVFPYGAPDIQVRQGGLDVPHPQGQGNPTIMANVAISVAFAGET